MDDNKNIENLRQQGWDQMSELLDIHMPVEKNRPFVWWYRLAGAAAIILLFIIVRPYLDSEDTVPYHDDISLDQISEEARRDPVIVNQSQDAEGKNAGVQKEDIADSQPVKMGDTRTHSYSVKINPDIATSNAVPQKAQARSAGSLEDELNSRTFTIPENINGKTTEITGPESDNGHDIVTTFKRRGEKDDIPVATEVISALSGREGHVLKLSDHLKPAFLEDMKPVETLQSRKNIRFFAFSEIMWSLSDQFGFLNAGPGVRYEMGKVTLGLSAGAALPVPRQKEFDSSNQNFPFQYNFSKELNTLADYHANANADAGQSFVYYENYAMNPGVMLAVSADASLSPRWSIGMRVGWNGFSWDFTQRAVPSQNVAASTDLTDLRSNLWYGGLEAGFRLSPHWRTKAGLQFINPLDPQNIGVLPSVRLQYEF